LSFIKGYKYLYPDVHKSGINSIKHFFYYGFWEGRYLSYNIFKLKEKYILNKLQRLGIVDEIDYTKLNRFKKRSIGIFDLLIYDVSKKIHKSQNNIESIRIEYCDKTKNSLNTKTRMKKSQLLFKILNQEKLIIVQLMGRTLLDSELRLINNNFPNLVIIQNDNRI
jgi:hypothetical protein